MNFDKLLKVFVPTDHAFFPLFISDAQNMVRAAELLKKLVNETSPEEREKINKEIKDVEHKGDEITNKTFEQLNKSFITPFDREDIHELTGNIDDVVDSINGISTRICLYKPREMNPVFDKMADFILSAAMEINNCVGNLEHAVNKRHLILDSCRKVNNIEHDADEVYFLGVQDIFENETDPKEVIKNNKIIETLERCVDEAEDVTDTIRTILIKMA
jgi:predicted phosphate transport protein (TIGR00153 family)